MDRSERKSGGVQSVERALTLLEILGRDEDGRRLSDLAREAGLPASTAHRLLTTLEARGFVQSEPETGLWHVGRTAFAIGASFARQRNFVVPALPYLRRLRDRTRETANLGVIDGGEVVTLSQVESREIMRAIAPPGGRAPILCSGMGKALIATWTDIEIEGVIARHGLRPMTPRSLRDAADVRAEIARVRAEGYAVDDEEYVTGMRCVAAVVWGPQGEAACAISVSGLAARVSRARVPEFGALVRAAADELTETLGGRRPE